MEVQTRCSSNILLFVHKCYNSWFLLENIELLPKIQLTRNHFPVFIINVILSPFRRIRPNCFLLFFFTLTSSASSRTKFMYSSKPIIRPSTLRSFCSNSHIWMRALLWRNLKIRLMGWVIILCTLVLAMAAAAAAAVSPTSYSFLKQNPSSSKTLLLYLWIEISYYVTGDEFGFGLAVSSVFPSFTFLSNFPFFFSQFFFSFLHFIKHKEGCCCFCVSWDQWRSWSESMEILVMGCC